MPRASCALKDNDGFLEDVAASDDLDRDAGDARRRPLRGAQADRRAAGRDGPARQDRAAHPHGSARRPLERGDRAVPDRPVVRQRQGRWPWTAIAAVRNGRTKFVPKNWEKTYFEWMENIQPWCVSRQLWWGHQIPAWYGPDGKVFVAETEDEAVADGARLLRRPTACIDAGGGARRSREDADERRAAYPHARRGRARHLVLLGAVAVLDAGLAGRDAGGRSATTRPTCWSPASTSSSSGSPA